MTAERRSSYDRILRTTAMVGGASAISVALAAIRTKVVALELGPESFGVMGLYSTLILMIQSIASLGIGQSAVRTIATATASGNQDQIAFTICAYRRIVLITGSIGLILTLLLAYPASAITFGNQEHVWAIAGLSIVVALGQVQAGQTALLQGMRRIGDLSALNVTGAFVSTVLAIPLLLTLGERGIVPFLVTVAVGQLVGSWWYARRVRINRVKVSVPEMWHLTSSLLPMGLAFVISATSLSVSAYVIRVTINSHLGEAAVGLYQSAFTISNVYVGFVLSAMGSDYYPRLAEIGTDTTRRNELVNEQLQIAMLLAVPGMVAALVLSEILIGFMYSSRFEGASIILRWQILGLLGRIISWPMGFILLARNDNRAFIVSEVISTVLHVALVWIGVKWLGAEGAGAGFAGLYLFYVILIYGIVRCRHGFSLTALSSSILALGSLAVALTFATTFIPAFEWRLAAGLCILFPATIACCEYLASTIPGSRAAALWRCARGFVQMRTAPSNNELSCSVRLTEQNS